MIDQPTPRLQPDNFRTLLRFLSTAVDMRMQYFRKGTGFQNSRPSDIRVFAFVALGTDNISAIARLLNISRQAVHLSLQRLIEAGLVELRPNPADRREKSVYLTEDGLAASAGTAARLKRLDQEMSEVIGSEGVETLRKTLTVVLAQMQRLNEQDGVTEPFV